LAFEDAVSFHGHVCPGLAMGYRMACAGLDALAETRAPDEEIVAVVENDACGVDALQVLSGCTFGKGNLIFRDYGKSVYTLYSRTSGVGVRVVWKDVQVPEEAFRDRAAYIRWILDVPQEEVIAVRKTRMEEPARADSSYGPVRCVWRAGDVDTRSRRRESDVVHALLGSTVDRAFTDRLSMRSVPDCPGGASLPRMRWRMQALGSRHAQGADHGPEDDAPSGSRG